jgi:hypothetical protein
LLCWCKTGLRGCSSVMGLVHNDALEQGRKDRTFGYAHH